MFQVTDVPEYVIVADRLAASAHAETVAMTLQALKDMGLDVARHNRKKGQRARRLRERNSAVNTQGDKP